MRPVVGALRIGTRGSPLALIQARLVAEALRARAGATSEIVTIQTTGDRGDGRPSGGSVKGLFVKELEEALLQGSVDVAVHSAKDMSAVLPPGLVLVAALPREDASDALVLPTGTGARSFEEACRALGPSPRVGTGSVRRSSQLRAVLPHARFEDVRGNVDTRLRKLDEGHVDALVLATAGLVRLGLGHRITCRIPQDVCVPAPGQGIIALEARADAAAVRELLEHIGDADAWLCLCAERAAVAALGAGCQMPVGVQAEVSSGGTMAIRGVVAAPNASRAARAAVRGPTRDAVALGTQLATTLLTSGGTAILDELRSV